MPETGYINYGTTQSNVPAELKVYYNVVTRTASNVTIDIDVGVHYTSQWSSNGCWMQVSGENRSCNPNHVTGKYYWYASSQGNSRSSYWKRVTLSAAAATTSVSLSVGFSNKAYAAGTFQFNNFNLNIPVGNTNAYWPNPICTVSPSGTFSEDNGTLNVSWSSAKDDQGDQIQYRTEIWKNGSFTNSYINGSGSTKTSGTLSVSGDAQGTSYYFRTHCKDPSSSNWVFGKQSSTVTKNKFTMLSSFAIASPTSITPGSTYNMTCTHNTPSNTNGNTTFTYGLSAQFVNSNGSAYSLTLNGVTSARVAATSFTITIWDGTGTAPIGMYIRQSDIKAACASYAPTAYTGTLRLTMTCSNAYGSLGTITSTKAINWQYIPESPTPPNYSESSFYNLPNMTDPVFIINKRTITWTWGAVNDPNGTAVSYQVYSKTGNNSWVLMTTTTSTSYTTPITALTQSQAYQVKIIAKFTYGTVSPENGSMGPQITLHYYNNPIVKASVVERGQTDVIIKTNVTASTSISNSIGSITLAYGGIVNKTVLTNAPPYKPKYEKTETFIDLEEITSGNIALAFKDSIMSLVLGSSATITASVVITQWSALLTIREKGIGINAIAGDFADITMKGTTTIHGGNNHGLADGSINFTVATDVKNPYINWYQGAYFDSEGKLRAAQTIEANTPMIHLQFYNSGSSSVDSGLRKRYWSIGSKIEKDDVFPSISYSLWYKVPLERIGSLNTPGFLKISDTYSSNLGVYDTAASQTALYNTYNTLNSRYNTINSKFTSGTWTPKIDGKSGNGYYFKVDKLCHVYGAVTLSAKMSDSTINGLPFTFYDAYASINVMFGGTTSATGEDNNKIGPYVNGYGHIIFTSPNGNIYTGFHHWTRPGSIVYIWGTYRTY